MLAVAGLLACVWCAYSPGLHGGFLFDDFVNLDALGATGRVDDWPTFWRYITSGTADPTGRPLALLSFLLDARDWPADPRPFLRTNILLHLTNAALLFALVRQLERALQDATRPTIAPLAAQRRSDATALIGTALWASHPLFVSTTLYVVQREALLATTFTLLGLLSWSRGRRMVGRAPMAGSLWMIGGIGIGTLLATLSKANGALLPLLAWVLDATAYREVGSTRLERRLRWLLLRLPASALFAYLFSMLPKWSQPLESRPWTIGQRILSEPRVLFDYLHVLAVPRVLSTGVYNDSYVWSTSLLDPATTLPALLGLVALVVAGFALRRIAPAIAAALLFFFAGHALESTTVPLELYFEHRNYLPAMLLGWPIARGISRWRSPAAIRALGATGLVALLAVTTWQRTALWADQPRMAGLWAAITPTSSRAIATQALFDIHGHRPDLALAILAGPWQRRPYDLQLALNYLNASCLESGPTPDTVIRVERALRHATEGDQLVYRWLGNVLDAVRAGACPGVDLATVDRWTRAALENRRIAAMPGRPQDLHAVLGRVALARDDAAGALNEFMRALDSWPTPDAAAQQSAWLAAAGHPAEGLALLDHFATIECRGGQPPGWNMTRVHYWVLNRQGYWANEFAELRRKMRDELQAQGKGA